MSSVSARKDEILAKKAKLAELKRQRELRQKEFTNNRQSLDAAAVGELAQPSPLRGASSQRGGDLDALVSSLVDRPSSTTPGTPGSVRSGKRVSGIDQAAQQHDDSSAASPPSTKSYQDAGTDSQTLTFAGLTTVYEIPVESKPEYISYSKGVQTSGDTWQPTAEAGSSEEDAEDRTEEDGVKRSPSRRRTRKRNLSPREREIEEEEEIRQRLRVEIEEELRSLQLDDKVDGEKERFPVRSLAPEELDAVTHSNDFLDFVERSSKVIERALDEEYDVLADYALHTRSGADADAEEDDDYTGHHRRGRRIKEVASFDLSDAMGRKRMVSSIDFSPKFPELACTAYTKSQSSPHTPPGLLNVWNSHLKGRPEYSLHATSDLLSCLFHPHHPSLILGGTYSGQLCLWDTRARHQRTGEPVQKTPLSGGRTGHAHPIYSLAVVGTQNASSIISVSTDGVVCAWSTDMLTLPQEYLELYAPATANTNATNNGGASTSTSSYKTDDVAPTSIAFPASDPTYFLAGTEQGAILPVHRYDRAGAKAGIDARCQYRSHSAPVMGIDFHPARGKLDLGDLFLSCGLDWSVKVWRAKPPSATAATISGTTDLVRPLLTIPRADAVYDVRWSPTRPSIFGCVDGAGTLDVYDLNVSSEIPVSSAQPSHYAKDLYGLRSLNRLAWEKSQGRHVAVGGLDGVVSLFEVGSELGGQEGRGEAWVGVKRWAGRMQGSQRQGS